jgi:DNA-directed RNA polymerase specialized sigma24 family protein
METKTLNPIIASILPKLYSFAYVIAGESTTAEQLLVDAFGVYLLRDKTFLQEYEQNFTDDKKERAYIQRYLFLNITREVYKLGSKRVLHFSKLENPKNRSFYELPLISRSIVYLKEEFSFSLIEMKDIFGIEKHELVSQLYFGRDKLYIAAKEMGLGEGTLC